MPALSTAPRVNDSCSPTGTTAVITSLSTQRALIAAMSTDEAWHERAAQGGRRMNPDLFSAGWFSALASIIVIDLILAGDNALVIGLAARTVPAELRRRVIWWGTAGAIAVRALLTVVVVWLLRIPGFLLIGGL